MTPSMVERVARAIFPEAFRAWDQYQREPGWGEEAGKLARKPVDDAIVRVKLGLAEMREPTETMIAAADDRIVDALHDVSTFTDDKKFATASPARVAWAAAIDAAINEGK